MAAAVALCLPLLAFAMAYLLAKIKECITVITKLFGK
jgi:hypothetical protein